VILISVPDPMLAQIIGELSKALSSCHQKVVVACSDNACCEQLAELTNRGAAAGTLSIIPGYDDRWFLLEGDKAVERQVRPILAQLRITAVGAFRKRQYLEALESIGNQFLPCLKLATECLKTAGIPGAEASEIVERQVVRIMRSYVRSGAVRAMNRK